MPSVSKKKRQCRLNWMKRRANEVTAENVPPSLAGGHEHPCDPEDHQAEQHAVDLRQSAVDEPEQSRLDHNKPQLGLSTFKLLSQLRTLAKMLHISG